MNAEDSIRKIKKGEVYPDTKAMLIRAADHELQLAESRWGIRNTAKRASFSTPGQRRH